MTLKTRCGSPARAPRPSTARAIRASKAITSSMPMSPRPLERCRDRAPQTLRVPCDHGPEIHACPGPGIDQVALRSAFVRHSPQKAEEGFTRVTGRGA
jgi:hypothetical protein